MHSIFLKFTVPYTKNRSYNKFSEPRIFISMSISKSCIPYLRTHASMHDAFLPKRCSLSIPHLTPTLLFGLCSLLSSFSKRFHPLSARRVRGAGGLLIQRQVFGVLLGITPVSGLAPRWGHSINPSMALLVRCSDHPAWRVHAPACSCTEVADAEQGSNSERQVRRSSGAILLDLYPNIRVEYLPNRTDLISYQICSA